MAQWKRIRLLIWGFWVRVPARVLKFFFSFIILFFINNNIILFFHKIVGKLKEIIIFLSFTLFKKLSALLNNKKNISKLNGEINSFKNLFMFNFN